MALLHFDDGNFDSEVLQSNLPVLVDFSATWCGPCKLLHPVIEELAAEYDGRVKIGELDVEQAQKVAMRYGVMGVPTVILFKGGKIVDQTVGNTPKKTLVQKLDKLLS